MPMSFHLIMYVCSSQKARKEEVIDLACESIEIWIEFLDDIYYKFSKDDKNYDEEWEESQTSI